VYYFVHVKVTLIIHKGHLSLHPGIQTETTVQLCWMLALIDMSTGSLYFVMFVERSVLF